MKLRAAIAEFETDIQIWRVGRRFSATIGDRHYELDLHESNAGGYLLIYDGHVFDCRIEGRPESGKSVDVIVGKTHYSVTLTDSKRLRGATSAAAHGDAAARIIAPMPGKVVRVLVEVGVQVEAGAGIVTVEAMKMQNEMKSPKAGTVVAVNVQADATVNAGDVLAIIE